MNLVPVDKTEINLFTQEISKKGKRKVFPICEGLKITDIPGQVAIIRSPDNSAGIIVDADDDFINNDLVAEIDDNKWLNVSSRNSSVNISMNGGGISISGDGNVVMSGGRIFIDGKEIDPSKHKNKKERPINILIYLPFKTKIISKNVKKSLIAEINGKVSVKLRGVSESKIIGASDLKAECSGSSVLEAVNLAGKISLKTSGSSKIKIQGDMDNLEAVSSGSSQISIYGTINGDFEGAASGSSNITTNAKIFGNIEKDRSGSGRININS
jgi:hypothetical protein